MTDRPQHGYPVKDRSGVTVGWAWPDLESPMVMHGRDDRWEITTTHAGELAPWLARLAVIARSLTDNGREAAHLHRRIEILARAEMLDEEVRQIRESGATRASVARLIEINAEVASLQSQMSAVDAACKAVVS